MYVLDQSDEYSKQVATPLTVSVCGAVSCTNQAVCCFARFVACADNCSKHCYICAKGEARRCARGQNTPAGGGGGCARGGLTTRRRGGRGVCPKVVTAV